MINNTSIGIRPSRKQNFQNNPIENKPKVHFGSAQLNICAASDMHGKVKSMGDFYDNIKANNEEIFPDSKKPSTACIMALSGDVFMNDNERDYLTNPNKSTGDIQLEFDNKLFDKVKKLTPSVKVYYVPGNHDFDGGDDYLVNHLLKNANMTTILTNANYKNSPLLQKQDKSKIKNEEIIEIPDDKNPNKKHKVLLMGLTMPGVDFYTPNLVKGIDIIDRTNKKDINIKPEEGDLDKTYNLLNEKIKTFKKDNPDGAVVVMSHNGNRLNESIAKHVPDINVILNAHDHVDKEESVGKTSIVSLSKDEKKVQGVQVGFDDNGKVMVKSTPFYTDRAPKSTDTTFKEMYSRDFHRDMLPLFRVKGIPKGEKLSHEDVRYNNSPLANLVTDAIFHSVQKHDSQVQAYGMLSAGIRKDLPANPTNVDLTELFSGCINDLSVVQTATVSGTELTDMIAENVTDNLENKDRNPLIQWSGIQINKAGMKKFISNNGKTNKGYIPFVEKSYEQYIKIKDPQSGKYVPLDPKKQYKIALPKELMNVPNVKYAMKLKDKFKDLDGNKTMIELFKEDLKANNNEETVKPEERIITSEKSAQ